MRWRPSRWSPARSSTSSWAAWADSPRPLPCTTRRMERGIPVWCGGMLESGIGRAHNIALSTLEDFTLPGDVSASARYLADDIIEPEVTVSARRRDCDSRHARPRLRGAHRPDRAAHRAQGNHPRDGAGGLATLFTRARTAGRMSVRRMCVMICVRDRRRIPSVGNPIGFQLVFPFDQAHSLSKWSSFRLRDDFVTRCKSA